jgi:hypothetical protein
VLRDTGEATVREWFSKLGYDEDLYSIRSRAFMITFHCDRKAYIQAMDAIDGSMDSLATGLILEHHGQRKTGNQDIELYSLHSQDANGFTYGVRNSSNSWYDVTFDCTNNSGMVFSSGNPSVTKSVGPNSWELLMHS